MDEKAEPLLDADAKGSLGTVHAALSDCADWTAESSEACIRALAETENLKLGKVAQPMRAALTGSTSSPGIFDVLVLLGRDEALGRLKDLL